MQTAESGEGEGAATATEGADGAQIFPIEVLEKHWERQGKSKFEISIMTQLFDVYSKALTTSNGCVGATSLYENVEFQIKQ